MAMNGVTWGDNVAAAVKALGISAGAPITDAQLEIFWRAVKGEDITHLIANAEIGDVATTGVITSGAEIDETTESEGTGSITA